MESRSTSGDESLKQTSSLSSDQSWTIGSVTDTTSTSPTSSASRPQSPALPPKPSRVPRRYPSDLSRRPKTRNTPQTNGTEEHTYESLEDLLRVHGYKETRVFTPESEERTAGDDAEESGAKVGDSVFSFLTGWVPGASNTIGRLAGAKVPGASGDKHEQRSSSPDVEPSSKATPRLPPSSRALAGSLPFSLNSPHYHPTSGSLDPERNNPHFLRQNLRSEDDTSVASDPLSPSSSSSTIRPSAHQLLHQQNGQVARRLSPRSIIMKRNLALSAPSHQLRHAISAPNIHKHRSDLRRSRSHRQHRHSGIQKAPAHHGSTVPDSWVGSLANLLAIKLSSSPNPNASRDLRSEEGRHTAPKLIQAIATAGHSSAEVRTSNVFCKSAPNSRSTSRVRGEERRKRNTLGQTTTTDALADLNLTSPLLSPSLGVENDDPIALLFENHSDDDAALHFAAYRDHSRARLDSDPDPPNLDAILSAHVASTSLRRQASNNCTYLREGYTPSSSMLDSNDRDLSSQRQRSIRSLRATLAASQDAASNHQQPGQAQERLSSRLRDKKALGASREAVPPVPPLPPQFRVTSPDGTSSKTVFGPSSFSVGLGRESSLQSDSRRSASLAAVSRSTSADPSSKPQHPRQRTVLPDPWLRDR